MSVNSSVSNPNTKKRSAELHPSGINLLGRLFRLWDGFLRSFRSLGSSLLLAADCFGSTALILAQVAIPLLEYLVQAIGRTIQPFTGLGILDVIDALRLLDDTRLNGSNLNVFASEGNGNLLSGSSLGLLFLAHVTFPRDWPSNDNVNIIYN